MAKLTALPSLEMISKMAGVIDYYVYYPSCPAETGVAGTPCARRWPRSPGHHRAPAVEAQWQAFAWPSANWNYLSPEVQEAYRTTAQEAGLTGRDLFTKSFIADYFREGQWD